MGYFRRKAFKKLREKVSEFEHYEIGDSCQLFGPPFGTYSWSKDITALNPQHAAERFYKKYRRINKQIHDHESIYSPTSATFGHIRVTNLKTGFKTYF